MSPTGFPACKVLLVLLVVIALCNFTFALLMPPLAGGRRVAGCALSCFGLGNGATFQLVPHRWKGKTGVMTGIIGAAGGIGGFYLPVIMGMAKESTGSYQLGFVTFGVVATAALAAGGAAASAMAGMGDAANHRPCVSPCAGRVRRQCGIPTK